MGGNNGLNARTPSDLLLTLLLLKRWSLLPELLDFFGQSQDFYRFVDCFGGASIRIPSREEMGIAGRNLHIWQRLRANPGGKSDLMSEHSLSEISIDKIVAEVESTMKESQDAVGYASPS